MLQEELFREEEEIRMAKEQAEIIEAEKVELAIRKEEEDQAVADATAALQV